MSSKVKFFVLVLTAFAFTGAGGQRQPASSNEERMDRAFTKMITSQDPKADLMRQINQRVVLYIKAQELVHQFDLELDSSVQDAVNGKDASSPIYGTTYAHLMKYLAVSKDEEIQVAYEYFTLLQYKTQTKPWDEATTKLAPDEFERRRSISGELLKTMADYLKDIDNVKTKWNFLKKKPTDDLVVAAVALFDLRMTLVEMIPQYLSRKKAAEALGIPFQLQFSDIDLERQDPRYVPYFEKEKAKVIEKAVAKVGKDAVLDPETVKEIEDDVPEIQEEINAAKNTSPDREPQQNLKIFPSATGAGNLTGNTFPVGTWAITYDDGPHALYTQQDLDNLKTHDFKATFFWLAENVQRLPKVIDAVKAANMPINNHSWDHPQLSKQTDSQLEKEIDLAQSVETKLYGFAPTLFRCPYGDGMNKESVRSRIVSEKMVHVFWNVDSLDWQDKNPQTILARTQKQIAVQKHGIILFHDIHPQSVAASNLLMTWFRDQMKVQRLRLVTIPDVINEMNGQGSAGNYSGPPL